MSSNSAENTTEADVSRLTKDQATAIVNTGMPEQLLRASDRWQEGELRGRLQKLEYKARTKWFEDPEATKSRRLHRYLGITAIAVSIATACGVFTLAVFADEPWRVWSPVAFAGVFINLCLGGTFYVSFLILRDRYRDFAENYIALAEEQPESSFSIPEKWLSDPDLQNLLLVNRAQLNVYQDIATKDATAASRQSRFAISFGFLILVAGAVGAIWTNDVTSKIVVGALASLGSVLSGYIGQTFLKAQAQARKQLNYYFHQPLVASYLLSAERIALKLNDDSSTKKALLDVIKNVLLAAGRAEEPDSAPSSTPRRRPRRSYNAVGAATQETQPGN